MTGDRSVRIASSSGNDATVATRQVLEALQTSSLAGVLLFCSSRYDLEQVACEVARERKDLPIIGCTTAGEITPSGALEGAIVGVGFPAREFALQTVAFSDLDNFDPFAAHPAVIAAVSDSAARAAPLGGQVHQAGVLLIDGLSRREELITHTLQHILGEIPLIGGSAADDMAFRRTALLYDGAFRSDAAVMAILSSTRPLEVFRCHHHAPSSTLAVVTRANAAARRVHELNGERAAAEYARLVGVAESALTPEVFASYPPMVRVGGEYFTRSVLWADEDGSLVFGSAIDRGVVLRIGRAADMARSLSRALEDLAAQTAGLDAVLVFESVLNRIEATRAGRRGSLAEIYGRYGVCGFNTYGEQFREIHVNQNLVGLTIGGRAP